MRKKTKFMANENLIKEYVGIIKAYKNDLTDKVEIKKQKKKDEKFEKSMEAWRKKVEAYKKAQCEKEKEVWTGEVVDY